MGLMAHTVLGPVSDSQLGFTPLREHLVFDGSSVFVLPDTSSDRATAHRLVGWDTLNWLRHHPYKNLDNVRMCDDDSRQIAVLNPARLLSFLPARD